MSHSTGTTANINWMVEDYFEQLLKTDREEFGYALELMVDDLHKKKEKTVNRFMCHQRINELLFALLRLLSDENMRVAGNTAYILGCLAESQIGCYRLLSTVTSNKNFRVLQSLVSMLQVSDGETVMNAAGTIGTMAESKEGRDWILGEDCLHDLIDFCSGLLASDNQWTGSNAALVLARLSISDRGCSKLAGHGKAVALLSRLCHALGCDEAGRGMNAAFALGRLVDAPVRTSGGGLLASLAADDLDRLVRDLADMTGGGVGSGSDQHAADPGSAKNACFCLSCLAGSEFGHSLVLADAELAARLLQGLARLLTGPDEETAWFAALAIRILSSKPKGAKFLRNQPQVVSTLQKLVNDPAVSLDLREEILSALEFLKPLDKPFPPVVDVRGCTELSVRWLATEPKNGFPVSYELHCNQGLIYQGDGTEYCLNGLSPATTYAFRLRVCTEADKSPFSEAIVAATEEAAPSKPQNLRVLTSTATQLKVGWDASASGSVRTYIVYCDGRQVDCTTELTSIISGLSPCTQYKVQVCASSSKGKSERVVMQATTLDLGAHAPPKPQVTVLGRHEMSVTWEIPEQPLGRINHYNVVLNGKKVVYTGTDMACKVSPLTADTEYFVTVVVVTNEGKAESKPTKRRTAKDEFDPQRAPLWAPNRRYSQTNLTPGETTGGSGGDSDNRRGSLAKVEPTRLLKPPQEKSEPTAPVVQRRRSLPQAPEAKLLREIREPRQLTSLAPTTLVLDRFGAEGGSHLRRVNSDDVRGSIQLSERPQRPQQQQPLNQSTPLSPLPPTPPLPDSDAEPSPPSPSPESSSSASETGLSDAQASAAAASVAAAAAPQLSNMIKTRQQPTSLFPPSTKPRSNAKSELEPLPAIGDVRQPPQQQQQQQPKKQRVRPPNRRRKSQDSVWFQSRSLVNKQREKEAGERNSSNDAGGNESAGAADRQFDSSAADSASGANGGGHSGLLSLNSRSSTDRFKTNLAILSSKSFARLADQQSQIQQQSGSRFNGSGQPDGWIHREATSTGAVGRYNRQGTLLRLGGLNRERTVMPTKSMEFSMKPQPQRLDYN